MNAGNSNGQNTRRQARIPRNLSKLAHRLKAIELEESLLGQERRNIRSSIGPLIDAHVTKNFHFGDRDKLQDFLSELYWSHPVFAKAVRDIASLWIRPFGPNQYQVSAIRPCQTCGTDMDVTLIQTSHSGGLTQCPARCPNCEQTSEKRDDSWRQECQKRQAEREAEIKRLRNLPYHDYLKSDHWKRVRYKALKRAKFRCSLCNSNGKLNVHHRTYENLGDEQWWEDLIVLCQVCHERHHGIIKDKGPETSREAHE